MPLLPLGVAEAWRARQVGNAATSFPGAPGEAWKRSFGQDVQDYLEVAAWYMGLGDWLAANDVLQAAREPLAPPASSPLVDYYLASVTRRSGQEAQADSFITGAGSLPYEKVFPSRLADVQVLGEIVMRHPLDTHALCEFGDFLFARGRYDDAARLWLQALGEGLDDAVLERNLGVFAWRVKRDLNGAGRYYSKAIQLAPNDYRLYRDLDEIYSESGDTSERVKLFAGAPSAVLERDAIRVRRALLDIEQKQFDRGLEMLRDHRFKPWEGGEVVQEIYVLAQVERGKQQLQAGHAAQAESAFRAALEYPPHLGVGKPDQPRDGEPLYWLGEALKAQGKLEQARAAWHQAAEGAKASERPPRLYAALALRQLGLSAEADGMLNDLVKAAGQENAGPWQLYVSGLAERARNNPEAARRDFSRALESDPSFWQARLKSAE
jgi:tetratricopeptide (TPR) repeat protein